MPNTSGLVPWKPGDVPNPTGANQYTYRADAERSLEKWCKEHGDEVIERVVTDARAGKGYAMKLLLERILPAVQKHEHSIPGADDAALEAGLDAFMDARREAKPSRHNGSGRSNGSARGDA